MPIQAVKVIEGTGAPLRLTNVDTDQIIPAAYMKRITRTGFEDGLFAAWRKEPVFVLNQPEYVRASILIAGPDFGTGSSRKHAVWALMDYGFRAVISPRFADIFRGNAGKAGLLAAQVTNPDVNRLWDLVEAEPSLSLRIDLENLTIQAGGLLIPFELDPDTQWRLLNGLDDIDLTLQSEALITSFEQQRHSWLPTTIPGRSPAEEPEPYQVRVTTMPAPSTATNADESSRAQDLLRRRQAAGIGTAVLARQENSGRGRQSSVLADWRELLPGDSIVLLPSSGEAVAGVIDDVFADGSVIWIFQNDCGGRRLFHRADSYKTLLDVGARAQEPYT